MDRAKVLSPGKGLNRFISGTYEKNIGPSRFSCIIKRSCQQLPNISFRIIAEIEQFKKGLGSFGFLDAVMEYKEEIQSLLCIDNSRITLDRFKSMLQYNFSPEGSNARRTELDTVYAFEVFIQDCCGIISNFYSVFNFYYASGKKFRRAYSHGIVGLCVPQRSHFHTVSAIMK